MNRTLSTISTHRQFRVNTSCTTNNTAVWRMIFQKSPQPSWYQWCGSAPCPYQRIRFSIALFALYSWVWGEYRRSSSGGFLLPLFGIECYSVFFLSQPFQYRSILAMFMSRKRMFTRLVPLTRSKFSLVKFITLWFIICISLRSSAGLCDLSWLG